MGDLLKASNTCVECHQAFPAESMVSLEGFWCCAGCKPRFLQRLAEGSSPPLPKHPLMQYQGRLVVRQGVTLPARCLHCNQPTTGYAVRRHLILIEAKFKYLVMDFPLCVEHRQQRAWALALQMMTIGLLGTIWILHKPWKRENDWPALVFLFAGLFVLDWAHNRVKVVKNIRYCDGFVWLKGVGNAYLENLPEWPIPLSKEELRYR